MNVITRMICEVVTLALILAGITVFLWTAVDPPVPMYDCHTDMECMERYPELGDY